MNALEQAFSAHQQVLRGRRSNVRLANLAELQTFGRDLRQALRDNDSNDCADKVIVIAWTFGGKVPLKLYTERTMESGFSHPFVQALSSWFEIDKLEDIDMSIATTWKTRGFEPYVRSYFGRNMILGNLDSDNIVESDEDLSQPESRPGSEVDMRSDDVDDVIDRLAANMLERESQVSDDTLVSADEDVIADPVPDNDVPMSDASLGATVTDADCTFYCR
jgi:hypothetical protein